MSVDAFLVLLSLVSFAVLIVSWVAAPLHAESPEPSKAAPEASRHTVAA